jgi:hypothetical protein
MLPGTTLKMTKIRSDTAMTVGIICKTRRAIK